MYYIKDEFKQLVRSLGGEWNDKKKKTNCVSDTI